MFGVQSRVIASITLRATMGRKRVFLFAIPPLILVLVTVALKLAHPPAPAWPSHILGDFGFSVVLPLTALIIGTSVLGAEIDDGSVVHLLATPVRRTTVIVTKFVVAAVLTMIFVAVPELLAGLIATGGATRLAVGEAVLGNFVSGARVLSVEQYSLGVANSIARNADLNAHLSLTTAIAMGAVVTALTLAFAVRRLGAFSLKGDAV
jgi:ABC-2 type transport system permease protein